MTSELDHLSPDMVEVGGGSYELFYMRQRKRLMSLAYVVSGSRVAAEDLAQEALVAAYKSWETIQHKDNPEAWVRRILLNKAASHTRRRLAEVKAITRRTHDLDVIPFPEVTGEIDQMWQQVRKLPKRQTQVIALIYVEGLTPTEIADVLDISKESVSTHMRRARNTLAKRLGLEDK